MSSPTVAAMACAVLALAGCGIPGVRSLPAPGAPPGPDATRLVREIQGAYAAGGFPGVVSVVRPDLALLEAMPMYHGMVRHLLESVARTAALAPLHAAAAEGAGLPSTVPLSELLLRLHLAVLVEAGELDTLAAPLQEQGVPIVCRDVPAIPYPRWTDGVLEHDVGEDGEASK